MIVAAVLALSLGGLACPALAQQQTAAAPCSDGAGMHHDTSPQKHAKLTVCAFVCLADLPEMTPNAEHNALRSLHFQLPNPEGSGFSLEVATPPPRWSSNERSIPKS